MKMYYVRSCQPEHVEGGLENSTYTGFDNLIIIGIESFIN